MEEKAPTEAHGEGDVGEAAPVARAVSEGSEETRPDDEEEEEEEEDEEEGEETAGTEAMLRVAVDDEVVLREMPLEMLRAIAALLNAQPVGDHAGEADGALEGDDDDDGDGDARPPDPADAAATQMEHLQGLRQALLFMHHRMAIHAASHRTNASMVDGLETLGCVTRADVGAAFRAVDRAEFLRPFFGGTAPNNDDDDQDSEEALAAYADRPIHARPLHVSAPSVYASAVEALDLRPGLSFLNVGSGSGYFSAVVAHLVGPSAYHVGLELRGALVKHARAKFRGLSLFHGSSSCSSRHYPPEFVEGDVADIDVATSFKFDRVYVGAGARREARFLFGLLKEDGVLVGPFEDDAELDDQALIAVTARGGGAYRVGRTRDSSVNFAWLVSDKDPAGSFAAESDHSDDDESDSDDDDESEEGANSSSSDFVAASTRGSRATRSSTTSASGEDHHHHRQRPECNKYSKRIKRRRKVRFGGPVWRRHPAAQFPASFLRVVGLLDRAVNTRRTHDDDDDDDARRVPLVARLPWADVWQKQILAFVPSDAFEGAATPPPVCATCGRRGERNTTFAKCFRCDAKFCSKTCQRKAWSDHLEACSPSLHAAAKLDGKPNATAATWTCSSSSSSSSSATSSSTSSSSSEGAAQPAAPRPDATSTATAPSEEHAPGDAASAARRQQGRSDNDDETADDDSERARSRARRRAFERRKDLRDDNWLWDEDLPPCPAASSTA